MSFFRSVLIASLISLLAALGLLFLGFSMGYEEFRGGYAVVTVDESVDDRYLHSALETGLFIGGEPMSESSQWVLLDEFDSVKKIPLDQYFNRVFPFDPRYDGYAEKLKNLFVRDGKRFAYIPLIAGNWNSGMLDRRFNDILVNIPFSVNYYGIGRPFALFFIVYITASIILLIQCYINRKVHRSIVNIVPMVPVLSSLGFFGASGIGAAGLLFGLFILLKEPLSDLVNPAAPSAKGFKKRLLQLHKEIIFPYRNFWLFLPVFIAGFAVLIIFSQLKIWFLLSLFIVSFAVFFFSLRIVTFSGIEHKRFNPVTILKRKFPEFVFPLYILPFVIGAFLAMFFTPYMSGTYDSSVRFDAIIEESDYYNHVEFQASFSTRHIATGSNSFPSFFFDTDGLPSMDTRTSRQSARTADFPSFPLKHLMEFFNNVNSGKRTESGAGKGGVSGGIAGNLSLLVLLLFIFPGFIVNKKENGLKLNFDGLKRFSVKLRTMGINWNKKLLYNEKNQLQNRKDA
ncbi:MAG: hypothetical protein FWD28_09950 [Treponema sp.]|nr:hypothetical protein [Treponema sp.]